MSSLLPQQITAIERFKKFKVGALFMDMGTGKTRTALELVNYNNVDLLIYICPASATIKDNIQTEIDKWGVNCDYKIIGYETIASSDRSYLELLNYIENKKVFIIADESAFIKNEITIRFERLFNLRKYCEYALILTGTPITKNEWDLYNQMYFLSPKIIGMNRQDFLNSFFKKVTYKKSYQREKHFYKFSDVNASALYKMIEPYIFNASLIFDKETIKNTVKILYKDDEYYEVKRECLERIKRSGNCNENDIINMLTKLQVVAACYDVKLDKLCEYVDGRRVIVFCSYLNEVKYIAEKIPCLVITGDTAQGDRAGIIREFESGNAPLVMTFGVGAHSLNLQACNEVVYSSISFDYAKIEQSEGRIRRVGQQNDVKYTYFMCDLGINKMMIENLQKKENLSYLVKEKIQKGEIEEWVKSL